MKCNMKITVICAGLVFAAVSVNAQISERLVGWWKMDESVGATTLTDSSGYGRNATLGAGASIIGGQFGNAVLFDGSTDAWARFVNPATLTNFTLSAWVYVNSFTNSYPKMFQLGGCYYQFNTANPGRFGLGIGTSPRADWLSNGPDPFIAETGKWLHTAVTVERTFSTPTNWLAQPIFYINGIRCGTLQTPKTYSPEAAGGTYGYLGNTSPGGTRAFDGAMDDVRIYDQVLSDREILDIYQNCPVAADAGVDQTSSRGTATLKGRLVSTNPYSAAINATSCWSIVSAPTGELPVLEHPELPVTRVSLLEEGLYVFRLTAVSEQGTTSSDVTVIHDSTIPAGNNAPVVTLPWTTTNTVLSQGISLTGYVTDDSTPSATPSLCWSKVSGPGGVFFDNAYTNETTAYFSTNGTYVLQLEADDGELTDVEQLTVTVNLPVGDLSEGLIHWWQMDENPDLTSSADSVGDNDLTLRYKTLLQPGKTGNGLRFPARDSYAQPDSIFTNAECFTFSVWIYYDAAYTNNIGKRIFDYGTSRFYLYFNHDKAYLSTRNLADTADYSWTQQNYSLENDRDKWVHLAVVYDRRPSAVSGKTQGFYINGVETGSTALGGTFDGSKPFTSGTFYLGGNPWGRNFDGVLDEIRVYDRLLTDEEIKLLAVDPDNNHAPVIESQSSVTVQVGQPASGLAAVYDDGQPRDKTLATQWSVVSGDASKVAFADGEDPSTGITFTKSGEYVLQLTASDGERTSAVNISVVAAPSGTLLMVQ